MFTYFNNIYFIDPNELHMFHGRENKYLL